MAAITGTWHPLKPCRRVGTEGDAAGRDVPDIALEVVWTSGVLAKLSVYAGLGVREVWVWERGELHAYALRGEAYESVPRSELLPEFDLALVASFVGLRQSEAVRALRDRLTR